MVLHALHLCSGYGGFELGLRHAGVECRTVGHVERDSYAAAVLVERMEQERLDLAPVWSDLDTFDAQPWAGRVELVTAGFPCQPFSAAGQRKGTDDDRWLWPSIGRIVRDVGPRYVFLENVPGLVRAGLPHVLADLADLGFDAEWGMLSAADVGAPHRRRRAWILAMDNTESAGLQRDSRVGRERSASRPGPADPGHPHVADAASVDEREPHHETGTVARSHARHDIGRGGFPPRPDDHDGWAEWIAQGGPQPSVRRSTDGRPAGLADALHLGGNGLVPQCAAEAFRQLYERSMT